MSNVPWCVGEVPVCDLVDRRYKPAADSQTANSNRPALPAGLRKPEVAGASRPYLVRFGSLILQQRNEGPKTFQPRLGIGPSVPLDIERGSRGGRRSRACRVFGECSAGFKCLFAIERRAVSGLSAAEERLARLGLQGVVAEKSVRGVHNLTAGGFSSREKPLKHGVLWLFSRE